jgi:D-glycero-alpha-D-manno-heptose-7-phosphate kinase
MAPANRENRNPEAVVRARAPLRLGFAGGGTDVSPFCDRYGGAVLNATINLYATTVIRRTGDGAVRFHAADRGESLEEAAAPCLEPVGPLPLHKAVYNRIVREFHGGEPLAVEVTTYCDAPAGSGLGSSSTLVVSMLQAFAELLDLPLGPYDVARIAHEVERVELQIHGGRQDQYAASFGGFNFMEFYAGNRVIVNPLRIKSRIVSELETSLVLYYSGVSRDSAQIIEDQIANMEANDSAAMEALQCLREEAFAMKEVLLRGRIREFARILGHSWEAKKKTARSITNPHIERLYRTAMDAGAHAGKVSGAGGGGFLMFIVDPLDRMSVVQALGAEVGSLISCHFVEHGVESWRV